MRPDLVVGTSVGALNGAILAAHPADAAVRLDRTWREMNRREVFPGHLLGALWRLGRTRTHAVLTDGLQRLASRELDASSFAQLEVPLAAVALDLRTARRRVLDSGPLVPALLASAAIPGVFPPVPMGCAYGRWAARRRRCGGQRAHPGGPRARYPIAGRPGLFAAHDTR